MTKKLITQLPPLDVAAFLFPGRWFKRTDVIDTVLRFTGPPGKTQLQIRTIGQTEWITLPEQTTKHLHEIQKYYPHLFEFVEPVEVEDDPPNTPNHSPLGPSED